MKPENKRHNVKMVGYAYPTSTLADDLGFKEGCYFVATGEKGKPLDHVVCGADNLADTQRMAETIELPYETLCGLPMNGNRI